MTDSVGALQDKHMEAAEASSLNVALRKHSIFPKLTHIFGSIPWKILKSSSRKCTTIWLSNLMRSVVIWSQSKHIWALNPASSTSGCLELLLFKMLKTFCDQFINRLMSSAKKNSSTNWQMPKVYKIWNIRSTSFSCRTKRLPTVCTV